MKRDGESLAAAASPDWWLAWLHCPLGEMPDVPGMQPSCGWCRQALLSVWTRPPERSHGVAGVEHWLLCPVCSRKSRRLVIEAYEPLRPHQRLAIFRAVTAATPTAVAPGATANISERQQT